MESHGKSGNVLKSQGKFVKSQGNFSVSSQLLLNVYIFAFINYCNVFLFYF